jgi:predicted ester cyclase
MGMPSHGNSIDVATCEIYEIADGLVVESWVYQDPGQLFSQMAAGQATGSSS